MRPMNALDWLFKNDVLLTKNPKKYNKLLGGRVRGCQKTNHSIVSLETFFNFQTELLIILFFLYYSGSGAVSKFVSFLSQTRGYSGGRQPRTSGQAAPVVLQPPEGPVPAIQLLGPVHGLR